MLVSSGRVALQLVSATSTRLEKLQVILGGVLSRTITLRVRLLVLPLASSAV